VELAPRFWVPAGVLILGAAAIAATPLARAWCWGGLTLVLFGLFLALQAAWLRLVFDDSALVVRRGAQVIRTFPYRDWLGWQVFWGPIPVLFYFREHASIHLLPMLFDGQALRSQLERRVPCSASPAAR